MFERHELEQWLETISQHISRPVSVYLIGGCAMSFRNLKDRTKDIDIITLSMADFKIVDKAIKDSDYKRDVKLEDDFYLTATAVFMKDDSRIDVFVKQVCKMLSFSQTMQQRATLHKRYGNLSVYLASNEDIFLFKSMTSRSGDLLDCNVLFDKNLNWKIVYAEIKEQSAGEHKWFFWTYEKICALEETKGPIIPIKEKVFGLVKKHWKLHPSDFMEDIADIEKHIPDKKLRDFMKR